MRTTRDQIPTDAWEVINELYRYILENIDQGVGKRARYEFLNEIVGRCQMLNGLLAGCMSHDEGYDFIRVGRNLERADMATRPDRYTPWFRLFRDEVAEAARGFGAS